MRTPSCDDIVITPDILLQKSRIGKLTQDRSKIARPATLDLGETIINQNQATITTQGEDELDQVNEVAYVGRIESRSNDSPRKVGKLEIVTESLELEKWKNEKAVSSCFAEV